MQLNSFDPFAFDGADPAAFAWAIFEMESRLEAATLDLRTKEEREQYPIKLPYDFTTVESRFYSGLVKRHLFLEKPKSCLLVGRIPHHLLARALPQKSI